MLKAGYWTNFS